MGAKVLSLALPLMLLMACLSNAQVYLGPSGIEWDGTCSGSCPESSPCQLSAIGTTNLMTPNPCIVNFQTNMTVPVHTIYADTRGDLTLTGQLLSFAGAFSVINPPGRIVLSYLDATTSSEISLLSSSTYMYGCTLYFTGSTASRLNIIGSGSILFEYSNVTSNQELFNFRNLVPNTMVYMSYMSLMTVGSLLTVDVPGTEPSIDMRDSYFIGFRIVPKLPFIHMENVVGVMDPNYMYAFEDPPTQLELYYTRISSSRDSQLLRPRHVDMLFAIGCHFDRVSFTASIDRLLYIERTTIFSPSVSYPMFVGYFEPDCTMSLIDFTLMANHGNPGAYIIGNSSMNWNVTNFKLHSGDTEPLLYIAVPKINIWTYRLELPALIVGVPRITFESTFSSLIFTGDVYGNYSSTIVQMTDGFERVEFHSIKNDGNIRFNASSVSSIVYHATKPAGILCSKNYLMPNIDCVYLPYNTSVLVSWEAPAPPVTGVLYPFVTNMTVPVVFTSSSSSLPMINSYFSDNTPSFSYSVPCASYCIPANSGPCTSTIYCTCKPGYEGVHCEISTGNSTSPDAPTPMPTPPPVNYCVPPPVNPPVAPTPLPTPPSGNSSSPNAPVTPPSGNSSSPVAPPFGNSTSPNAPVTPPSGNSSSPDAPVTPPSGNSSSPVAPPSGNSTSPENSPEDSPEDSTGSPGDSPDEYSPDFSPDFDSPFSSPSNSTNSASQRASGLFFPLALIVGLLFWY